jgi:hypothetical protein
MVYFSTSYELSYGYLNGCLNGRKKTECNWENSGMRRTNGLANVFSGRVESLPLRHFCCPSSFSQGAPMANREVNPANKVHTLANGGHFDLLNFGLFLPCPDLGHGSTSLMATKLRDGGAKFARPLQQMETN